MCELLGMSSNHETTINLSLSVLANRGESPKMHGDGWGIAFHDGKDVRLIKDTGQAKDSEWVEFIKNQKIKSHDIIAHIRRSTIGKVSYSNTHPFVRELLGRVHSFAHNGTLKHIKEAASFRTVNYNPIGETDSEHAFCALLDRMQDLWKEHHIPPLHVRLKLVKDFADQMRQLGPANFLYSDGDALFAHGDERYDPLTHTISWPGLHYLEVLSEKGDKEFSSSTESGIAIKGDHDVITLFASVPLNDLDWRPIKQGEVIVVRRGKPYSSDDLSRRH